MQRSATMLSSLALAALAVGVARAAEPAASAPIGSVVQYHGRLDRSGDFVAPGLTFKKARSVRLDPRFHARISGHVYAQPLYWRAPGATSGALFVVTENDDVYALDAKSGRQIWRRALGKPVPRSALPCGDINPLGITGTPVIDPARNALFLDAAIESSSGPRHRVFALDASSGATLPGWPVDIGASLKAKGRRFTAPAQNQRSALTVLDGRVYIPFGGNYGDCGDYHGWVIGVSLGNPKNVVEWSTRARGGGIWAPGGLSSDGKDLFAATGNTIGAQQWSDGEAVFRLHGDLARVTDKADFFAPANWRSLDARDLDLGGTNPLPLNAGGRALLIAMGKNGWAYLLDQKNLGGIGHALAAERVSDGPIRTGPATFPTTQGADVVFQGPGAQCPRDSSGNGLTMLSIEGGAHPSMRTGWCAKLDGRGSPIVTTTDGRSNPIVWALGAEGDNRLHAFRGDNGQPIANPAASTRLAGLRHFETLIATQTRLYAAGDGRVYAFAF